MKSRFNEMIISLMNKNGLPARNLTLGLQSYMVSWDSLTGEIKTIECQIYNEITYCWYDECANIDPKIFEKLHDNLKNK